MKTAECNKKTFYYRPYLQKTEIVDSEGYPTGNHKIEYGDIHQSRGSISPNKGTSSVEMFGSDLSYTKTIIVDDIGIDMDENSIVWIKNDPFSQPYDYVVVARAEGLYNVSFAVRKVDVAQ